LWRAGDERSGLDPAEVVTGADGAAVVLYPEHRDVVELTRTLTVSLEVDHPQFAASVLHIEVPLESDGPHLIELADGVSLEVRPLIDGAATDLEDIFVRWSDSHRRKPEQLAGGVLRIPPMRPGKGSLLLVKLDDLATHFSQLLDLDLVPGEQTRIDVPLVPSLRVKGVLSNNVPRPVHSGRLKTCTLAPAGAHSDRVSWFSWAPIASDGTFIIDGWPAGEPLQLIALCDGYLATSGRAPAAVKNPPDPATDWFNRPQVFDVNANEQIEVEMTPLAHAAITVVDELDRPVEGVTVASWPNVCWWNYGSQIYCHPLVRGERFLRQRDYTSAEENVFPQPFRTDTDADGEAMLELPAGKLSLTIVSDSYELPAFLGNRNVDASFTSGETTAVVLRVQPRGTETLGQWDKLAGVVFGCSSREGRRICALPGVQKKMEAFAERFREAKSQRDPQLLADAYAAVADAFVGVGDTEEAANWRRKADEQLTKAKAARPESAKPSGK
jgi:hypothetical protein